MKPLVGYALELLEGERARLARAHDWRSKARVEDIDSALRCLKDDTWRQTGQY